jgi:3-oxoadipate enol-lactonase
MAAVETLPPTRQAALAAAAARAVAALRPLAEAGYPLRVPADATAAAALCTVAGALGLDLSTTRTGPAGPFDPVVADVLRPYAGSRDLAGVHREVLERAADGADVVASARVDVVTPDGATLRTYALGDPGRPAVVIASACGMPAQLCEPWMRFLAATHYVVTWETRGLFDPRCPGTAFDALACDLSAQSDDLVTVMDRYGLSDAHVMGLCGGAVIAVQAAAREPRRVSSLSLWHGDFSGTPGPATAHQTNLKALLAMAALSRDDAAAVNAALAQTTLGAVPADVAHLVVYPYVNDELFYRYCLLTGATMTTDIGPLVPAVRQPTLVITSEDDHTAHPGGSRDIAARMPAATLRVEPHGDHISVFGAGPRLRQLLTGFLADPSAGPSA